MPAAADTATTTAGTARGRSWPRRAAIACLWVAAWAVAAVAVGNKVLLAGPVETARRLAEVVLEPTFAATVWFSLSRIAGGFAVAFAAAVALAFAAHRWRPLAEVVAPALAALKSVPIVCVIVLLLMWVGSRAVSGVAVFLAVFPAVYFSAVEALSNQDRAMAQMATVFGIRGPRRFLALTWPGILPFLVGTCRNVCGMAWKAGVAAELIGSPRGSIGERIYQAKVMLETSDLFAWTIVIVLAAWLCEKCLLWLLSSSGRAAMGLALGLSARGPRPAAPPCAVEVDAAVGYDGVPVASDLRLVVPAGGRAVLSDESGAGKTTLLATIAGLLPAISGTVTVPARAAVVFQETRLVEAMTARENVALADGRDAAALLAEILPEEALDVPVSQLSGGQRRRVELVRALAHPSQVVLLDEPFASLDEDSHRACADFVRRHLGGRTLVVASHAPGDAGLLDAADLSLS